MRYFLKPENEDTRYFIIGSLMLAGLFALIIIGSGSASNDDKLDPNQYILKAKFQSIEGIDNLSAVTLAGVDIGHVQKISLDGKSRQATLELVIDDEIALPLDSSIKVVSGSLFGRKYLKISPGSDSENLENGDSFDYTQSALILENVLEMIVTRAENANQ